MVGVKLKIFLEYTEVIVAPALHCRVDSAQILIVFF
jgi:hypothetical protein